MFINDIYTSFLVFFLIPQVILTKNFIVHKWNKKYMYLFSFSAEINVYWNCNESVQKILFIGIHWYISELLLSQNHRLKSWNELLHGLDGKTIIHFIQVRSDNWPIKLWNRYLCPPYQSSAGGTIALFTFNCPRHAPHERPGKSKRK